MDSLKSNNLLTNFLKSPAILTKVISLLYIFFIVFTCLQFIVLFTHESSSIPNVKLSYATNISIDRGQELPINKYFFDNIYLIGHFTCHQRSDRSFFINNNQMPICSRCLGIYLGMTCVFILALLRHPSGSFFQSLCKLIRFNSNAKSVICDIVIIVSLGAILSIPMIADGSLQIFTSYLSNNSTRLFTGFLFGLFEGGCVVGIISHVLFIFHQSKK